MTVPHADLGRFYTNCDPNKPLSGEDPRYVSLDEVRGNDASTCVDELEQTIRFSSESCQLFTGFPGTGKTTEIGQFKKRLNDAKDLPTHVVVVNFDEYIDKYAPISITDVVRVIAYCLDREATEMEGKDPDKQSTYRDRFMKFLSDSEIDMSKASLSALGSTVMLEIKNNPTFYRRVDKALSQRFQQFVNEARESMTESVSRLKNAQLAHAQRVVCIADGLEKIAPLRDDDRDSVEKSVEMLFATHAAYLRLPCHAIYTFPLWLRYRRADLGASYDREPLVLPMVKVTDPNGKPAERGIERLLELLAKRVDLSAVFGPDWKNAVRPLILASGGYPRDLLRLVRNLLTSNRVFPVGPANVERVIDQLAEDYGRTVLGTDLDVLVTIAKNHELPRDNSENLAKFVRLLDRYLVLAYRNGKEWYDAHPMVRRDMRVKQRIEE